MEKEIFNKLFGGGELEVLYSNLETLTPEQKRSVEIGLGIRKGQKESPVMNEYVENVQQKFEPQRVAKAMTGNSKLKGKTDDNMQENQEEDISSPKKDPQISKVAPNTHLKLKKGDSEADILAKMLNMMNENYDKRRKSQLENDKMLKLEDEHKNNRNKKLLEALGHQHPKKKKQKYAENYSWLKYAAFASLAGLGLFGMDKAFAGFKKNVSEFRFPDLPEITKNILDKIPTMGELKTDIGNLVDNLKSPEAVAGGGSTPELIAVMNKVKEIHPDVRINALNDKYHKEKLHQDTSHAHPGGFGADINIPSEKMTKEGAMELQKQLETTVPGTKVIYEPPNNSGANPSGHYHLQTPKPVGKAETPPITPSTKAPETEIPKPETPAKLQLVPKSPPLAETDVKVKEMQDVKGRPRKPRTTIIKQDTYNIYKIEDVKQGIQDVEARNWQANKEIPAHIVKQFGLQ